MALTRDEPRRFETSSFTAAIASTAIYQGACVGTVRASGQAAGGAFASTTHRFAGFATTRAAIGERVTIDAKGRVILTVAGTSAASVNAVVYASDDDTFNVSGSGIAIGRISWVQDDGKCVVDFDAGFEAAAPGLSTVNGNTVLVGAVGTWEMVNVTGGKGGVMLLNRAAVSEDAVDSVTDNWLWFKLEQQYGSAYNKVINSSEKLLTSELTLSANGTLNTGIFTDNAGWATPKGTAFLSFTGAAAATPSTDGVTEMFDLSTLTSVGGMLIIADVYIPTSALGGDDIIAGSNGSTQANYGEFRMYINSQQVLCSLKNKGGTLLRLPATQSGLAAGAHQIALFIDGVNMTATFYVDGVPATGGSASVDLSGDGTALPKMEHNRGVRVLARVNNASGGTLGWFGATDATRRIRDIKARRFERDVSADIPALVADVYAQSHTLVPYDWGQV